MATYDQLVESFQAHGTKGTCPWCDAGEWSVVGGRELFASIPFSNVEGVGIKQGFETLAMACQKCGYVQFHLTNVLGREHR